MSADDLWSIDVESFGRARLTVPEFAFVAGVHRRVVDREVDVKIIPSNGHGSARKLQGWDLFYLCSIKNVRTDLNQAFRKRLRTEIAAAAEQHKPEARVEFFHVVMADMNSELEGRFAELEAARHEHVEVREGIMGGQPVITGTRLAVRHIADLVKNGATAAELRDDYALTGDQISAAVLYDKITPRRGRPAGARKRTTHVPSTG